MMATMHISAATSQAVSRQVSAKPSCACSAAAVTQRPFLAGRSLQQQRLVTQPRPAPTRRQVGLRSPTCLSSSVWLPATLQSRQTMPIPYSGCNEAC